MLEKMDLEIGGYTSDSGGNAFEPGAALDQGLLQEAEQGSQPAAPLAVRCRRTGRLMGYVVNPGAISRLPEVLRQHGFEVVEVDDGDAE